MRFGPRDCWNRTALVLGTGFGIGYVPVMPGTFGTLLGIPLAWLLCRLEWPLGLLIAVEAGIILAGIPICGRAARQFGQTDPGAVVYDEIAALPLVFLFLPVQPGFTTSIGLTTTILGFLWFRIFDIVKPWPVRRFEKLPGGLGIVADDVVAAIFAGIALWITLWLVLKYLPAAG